MLTTRRRLATLALASVGAVGLIGAFPAGARESAEDDLPNVFFSPHGRPFRAVAGAPYPVIDWFGQADRKGDGKLDRDGFVADAAAFFAVLDLRGDGILDTEEIAIYEHQIAPEILGQRVTVYAEARPWRGVGSDGARLWRAQYQNQTPYGPGSDQSSSQGGPFSPGGPGQAQVGPAENDVIPKDAQREPAPPEPDLDLDSGAALFGLLRVPEPVTAADPDYAVKGVVRRASFLANAERNFATLDANGVGYLTLAGLPKTPIQKLIERSRR